MARTQTDPHRQPVGPTDDLVDALRAHGVTTEEGPGACRITASLCGRSMVLCRIRGWWAHERPTTGETVIDPMQPTGMEWVTARHIAAMLTSGYGVRL